MAKLTCFLYTPLGVLHGKNPVENRLTAGTQSQVEKRCYYSLLSQEEGAQSTVLTTATPGTPFLLYVSIQLHPLFFSLY